MNFAASSADGVPQCDNAADDFSRKVIRLAVRRLTRRHAYYLRHADLWVWPSITAALEECGMYTVREYISRRRQYLLSYSETRPLLASCHPFFLVV
jgi:L-rhamnose mutarotase